ncbi:hypothetical protein ACLM44_12530 [Synechococcus sp. W2B2]|uniref:hypothetical protein n=1 Tax=unclassified Synechococcus TaxID=2626047 RepID=UPI00006BB2F2|nr:hypothetical protein [Synechococcus sp. WH 7805]EAR19883.1 hypothetical protein WH7805_13223 [Synechococcus sp. WH 7805]
MDFTKRQIIIAGSLSLAVIGTATVLFNTPVVKKTLAGNAIDITNDVGERVVVKSKTIRIDPVESKGRLKILADNILDDMKSSTKPLDRNSVESCVDLETAAEELSDWTRLASRSYASSTSKRYVIEYQQKVNDLTPKCESDVESLRADREKLKMKSDELKDIVDARSRNDGWKDYTPTIAYKILLTDVNEKKSLTNLTTVCMTKQAVDIMPDSMIDDNYPYARQFYGNPDQLVFASKGTMGLDIGPLEDIRNVIAQKACESKGFLGVNPELKD